MEVYTCRHSRDTMRTDMDKRIDDTLQRATIGTGY
jgi:hypothetical protein